MTARASAVVAAALFIAANGAYAFGVADLLQETLPAMPFGFQEGTSPRVDAGVLFVDVTEASGVDFRRHVWSGGDLPYPAVIGGGIAVGDIDGDGWQDLYFPSGGPDHPAALYRNLGGMRFEDITVAAGLREAGYATGAAFADYDNDGDEDLFTAIDGVGRLYVNTDGNGTFVDRAAETALDLGAACGSTVCQPSSMVWADWDRDGDLDLYVVNNLDWRASHLRTSGQDYASLIYFAPMQASVLYRNDGGVFTAITGDAGVPNTGKGLAATPVDIDLDGWPDLATANDITQNALYINQGDGTFRNTARAARVNEVKTSMGIAAGDMDGDGDMDLVISNFRGDRLSYLLQGDDGRFGYATATHDLDGSWRGTGWGVALPDIDNDGWLDIVHAVGRAVPLEADKYDLDNLVFKDLLEDHEDQLFRNVGGGRFGEATYTAGAFVDDHNTRAIVAVDLDNDGDEDLVRVNQQGARAQILRNDQQEEAAANGWLQFTFAGNTSAGSNRDGYGARVEVRLDDGRTLVRQYLSAAGFQTGLPRLLHIGLGDAAVLGVTVHWPSGQVQSLAPPGSGRYHLDENHLSGNP